MPEAMLQRLTNRNIRRFLTLTLVLGAAVLMAVFGVDAIDTVALRDIGRPQALHLVVVIPGGIFAALMLYFLPQNRQAIFRVPEFCVWVAVGFGSGAASSVGVFNEIM